MKTPTERTVSGAPQVFVEWAEGGEYTRLPVSSCRTGDLTWNVSRVQVKAG